ncbi:unnamed protein product [Scytosiphon promiscuus]
MGGRGGSDAEENRRATVDLLAQSPVGGRRAGDGSASLGERADRTGSPEKDAPLAVRGEVVAAGNARRDADSSDLNLGMETPVLSRLHLAIRDAASFFRLCGLATVVASATITAVAVFLVHGGGRNKWASSSSGSFPGTLGSSSSPLGNYFIKHHSGRRVPTAPGESPAYTDRSPERSSRGTRKRRTSQGVDFGPLTERGRPAAATFLGERGSRKRRSVVAFEAGAGLGATDGDGDGGGGGVVAMEFPPVSESTVMFLHVFKCAGSTLRRMLVDWAEEDGQRGAIVHKCDYTSEEREVCLSHYQLVDEVKQREQISRLKVLAGHFIWGFQRHVRGPYLMITALRNPLEVFVSGQQYIHRKKTKTLEKAHDFVAKTMRKVVNSAGSATRAADGVDGVDGEDQEQLGGYIRRFVGKDKKVLQGDALASAAEEAVRNLDAFWIVGVVEQYAGFEEVLRRSLDPGWKHEELWEKYASRKYNSSPVGSRDVLAAIDPELVHRFNGSLALQWRVYEKAVSLWSVRCQEVLPPTLQRELCSVPSPAETYLR